MQPQVFEIPGYGKPRVELTGEGKLRLKIGFRSKEVPLTDVTSVRFWPSAGDRLMLRFRYRQNGAEKHLATISAPGGDQTIARLVEALRPALPPNATVTDEATPDFSDLKKQRVYSVGGRTPGGTLPRWGVIFFWYMLTPLVIPLFIAIYLTSRYRLYTDGEGLVLKRFSTRQLKWSQVQGYEKLVIKKYVNGVHTRDFFRITLHAGADKLKVVLSSRDGRMFMEELAARQIPEK